MTKAITAQKITPNLWFDNQAEEAVNFYTSIFENSKIKSTSSYNKEAMEAMLQMEKIDIEGLKQAAES